MSNFKPDCQGGGRGMRSRCPFAFPDFKQHKESNKMKLKMNCSIVRLFGLFDSARLMRSAIAAALVTMGLTAYAAEPEAVQLWENGPYWATSNLGESEYPFPDSYGALYTFDEADAAVKTRFGEKWRLPSKADFQRLISDCTWVWDEVRKGIVFMGKGSYSSNNIFLPAAGWDTGGFRRSIEEYCLYWSSTVVDSSYVWYFVSNAEGPGLYDNIRKHRMAVRPIRDVPPTVTVDRVTTGDPWCKITVDYTLGGVDALTNCVVVFDVTAGGRTARVTSDVSKLTNGSATKVIDTEALFGQQTYDANAKVTVSIMKVMCVQLWEGGPYWSECNVGAAVPGDVGGVYSMKLYYVYKKLEPVEEPFRLPNEGELLGLLTNCDKTWETCKNSRGEDVVGCRFTGRGAFGSKSIFLPARWFDSSGYYWSSDYNPSLTIVLGGDVRFYCALYFNSDNAFGFVNASVSEIRDGASLFVRTVRDDQMLELVAADEKQFDLRGVSHVLPVGYVDADGMVRSRLAGDYEFLTDNMDTIGGGRWYAVMGTVSRGTIKVDGSAHLILCDGAKLTVTGDWQEPGIAVSDGNSLTIYGQTLGTGELVVSGHAANGAGIGGGYRSGSNPPRRNGGAVTINGGRVTAMGGTGCAGIGGGNGGAGGTVTINGGTVTATGGNGASGIGNGKAGAGGVITIKGGNIVASSLGSMPVNGSGESLHKVTLLAFGGSATTFEGLDGYGLRDVVPVDGKYCFYLPDGTYEVPFESAGEHGFYIIVVKGTDVVSSPRQMVGLMVNGNDVGKGIGEGWTCEDGVLNLESSGGTYVLTGVSSLGEIQVRAASNCTVDLNDAIIYTQGRPTFVVDEAKTVTLRMKGGVSHLAATNAVGGTSVSAIEVNGTLNVDFAPDADQAQSAIYAFNFGDQPAIGGSGEVSIIGGHLCAWSDVKAVSSYCTFQIDASSRGRMFGQVGDSWDDVKLVGEGYYLGESSFHAYSKLEVAPAYWVSVPAAIEHVSGITVSNDWECLRCESVGVSGALTNRYFAMLDDAVAIHYEVDDGYAIISKNPQVISLLTNDVVIGSEDYSLPDVRKRLSFTLPESLDGETYVVMEDGREVEKAGGDSGVAVYPVLSGYDIEIVCTVQDGWRLVSVMNVATFANIQESRVLTAADLPQAWRVFTVSVPDVASASLRLTSTDGMMVDAGSGNWQILSNAEVTVTFSAFGNYRITANGEKTWTLTGDVVFGTTDGFPLPTLEGIPGTVAAPWTVGEDVQAYTNLMGVLTIIGTGAMSNFTNAADVPWDPVTVKSIEIGEEVTKIGANALASLADEVTVGGKELSTYRGVKTATVNELPIADYNETVKFLNTSDEVEVAPVGSHQDPSGSISGAEFERIDIVDGKAYLGVSVWTNSEVKVIGEGDGWGVATNGVIEVPAPGKQGFFYLMSKPATKGE